VPQSYATATPLRPDIKIPIMFSSFFYRGVKTLGKKFLPIKKIPHQKWWLLKSSQLPNSQSNIFLFFFLSIILMIIMRDVKLIAKGTQGNETNNAKVKI
jgi:hypothetical protein